MSQQSSNMNEQILDAAVELMGRSGRRGTVRVEGRSMRPILDSGDFVAIDFESRPPRFGDMLLFRQVDYLVIHRYVGHARRREQGLRYRTRGDAVNALDPPVDPERVLGRAVAFFDGRRWWDLDRFGARLYGLEIGLHDLFWAAMGLPARKLDRGLSRLGLPPLVLPLVAWVDRVSLRLAHPLIFRLSHRPCTDPTPAPTQGLGFGRCYTDLMLNALITRVVGSKNDRLLKKLRPGVQQINELEPTIHELTDDQLKNKRVEFRERFEAGESLDDMLPEAFAVVREASQRVLGMRHYDVQLIGGMVLHQRHHRGDEDR